MRWGIARSRCQESGQWEQELPSGEGIQITLCVWPLRSHLHPGLLSQVLGPRLPEAAFPSPSFASGIPHSPRPPVPWAFSHVPCGAEGSREGGDWDAQGGAGRRKVFRQWGPRKGA